MSNKHINLSPTVLLTGACGGIGTELAKDLVKQRANIYLVGRNNDALADLKTELSTHLQGKQKIETFCADLSDKNQITNLVFHLQKLPAVNVLINNAGVSHFGLFENTPDKCFESLLNTNVLAPMRLTQELLPMLKKQPWARIVNIGSVFGAIGYPGFTAYSASKFALRGFSQALARELSDTNVYVGHFCARATDTKLNSASVVAMNKALNTKTDSPDLVAARIAKFVFSSDASTSVGWPEKLFVKINAIAPSLVSNSLIKQLPTIKRFTEA